MRMENYVRGELADIITAGGNMAAVTERIAANKADHAAFMAHIEALSESELWAAIDACGLLLATREAK
jgi:hypothetical protein